MENNSEKPNQNLLNTAIEHKIEYRLNQSNGSRLAEVITGFTPEDPQIIDRLIGIQKRIYQKYSLPDITLSLTDPKLLSQNINEILDKNKISILTKDVTQEYFEKYPSIYAAYFKKLRGIGINTEKQKEPDYNHLIYYLTLLHETTHALQDVQGDFDLFSIEMLEFEATIAATTLSPLEDLDFRAKVPLLQESMTYMFECMYSSVENWEKQGGKSNRPHYNAENMLKAFDGITKEQVDLYKSNNNAQEKK